MLARSALSCRNIFGLQVQWQAALTHPSEKNSAEPVTFAVIGQDRYQEAMAMTAAHEPDTDQLLQRVVAGDLAARGLLLDRHRPRLRQMIAVRIDQRLAARLDPSDIFARTRATNPSTCCMMGHFSDFCPFLRDESQDSLRSSRTHPIGA
jgi:hypothetical protein